MDTRKLSRLLTHPFFNGLIITSILAIIFMPDISKYKVEVMDKKYRQGYITFFSDLDGDQKSEEIVVNIIPSMLKIMIIQGNGIKEQYNLRSNRLHNEFLFTRDYNSDGLKEIYLITSRNDSLFLSIIDPFHNEDFIVKERLVYYCDTISFADEYPSVYPIGLMDADPRKNILFALGAGYSKQPRAIYSYNIAKDILKVSPFSGVSFRPPIDIKLVDDSIPLILGSTYAVGNYNTYVPYTDQSAWLMVFNKDLEFLFNPIEFPKYPSSLIVSTFSSSDTLYIVALHEYFGTDTIKSGLYLYNTEGKKLLSTSMENIEMNHYYMDVRIKNGLPRIYVIDGTNSIVRVFDKYLKELRRYKIPDVYQNTSFIKIDIDKDTKEEYILRGEKPGSFVILRNDFKHPVTVDLNEDLYFEFFSTCLKDGIPYLYAQRVDVGYLLDYKVNPIYYLQFPLLVIIYLAISFTILLIFRLQKYRVEKYFQTQRRISELQILNLKNQIEPHFTFNILNCIGCLYAQNANRDQAYNIYVKYCSLLRFAINHSDKISIPIRDELDFVNSYVELEQLRSGNTFKYEIKVDEDVQLDKTIPRMLIHTFVENSIKHGVRMVEKDALLKLYVSHNKIGYKIMIMDNGHGLNSEPKSHPPGTGKGLQIIDEMIGLFYKLEGIKISYTLEDISIRDPNRQGTIADITIPYK